ncbi:hypothetical protein CHS0354_039684, partial [Potamilus streckersoni]
MDNNQLMVSRWVSYICNVANYLALYMLPIFNAVRLPEQRNERDYIIPGLVEQPQLSRGRSTIQTSTIRSDKMHTVNSNGWGPSLIL